MLGWIGDDNPDYTAELLKFFSIPEIEVGFHKLQDSLSQK